MDYRQFPIILLSVLIITTSLNGQIRYNAIDLGTLGGYDSCAYSINNNGQIVGESELAPMYDLIFIRAALFDPNGNNIDLGTLSASDYSQSSAYSINNAGFVVGTSEGYSTRFDSIFGWFNSRIGGSNPVPGTAYSINNYGLIVGTRQDINWQAFVHFENEYMFFTLDLGTLGGTWSQAYCVNDNAEFIQIVGVAENASGQQHAALFNSVMRDNSNIDLGTLGGTFSQAFYINKNGQIVGWASTGSADHAALFDPNDSGSNLDLGVLYDTDLASAAQAINNYGQIVGWSGMPPSLTHAAIFDSTGGGNNIDLNTLIDSNSGLELLHAYSINDNGWIVGDAVTEYGEFHAFVLIPIPQPCQYVLDGDLNNDCKADFFDFALMANRWFSTCQEPNWCTNADINQSGQVNFSDLLIITQNWLINCNTFPLLPACEPIS